MDVLKQAPSGDCNRLHMIKINPPLHNKKSSKHVESNRGIILGLGKKNRLIGYYPQP